MAVEIDGGRNGVGANVAGGAGAGRVSAPLRAALLAVVVLGILGLGAELILLEHYEEWQQWIPLVLLALGLPAVGAAWLRPNRRTLLGLRGLMAVYLVAGVVGVALHYGDNAAFERELDAGLGGLALVWAALRGATPTLAPGAMIHLGLIGLLATWRHPALEDRAGSS